MSLPIIGIHGKAGSGKDTLADAICLSYNGVSIGFADTLKQMVADIYPVFTPDILFGDSALRDVEIALPPANHSNALEWSHSLFPDKGHEPMGELQSWLNHLDDLSRVEKISARKVLQIIGTEWGRAIDDEIWIKRTLETTKALLKGGGTYDRQDGWSVCKEQLSFGVVVITDLRFPNEMVELKAMGGKCVHITRPFAMNTAQTGIQGHSSENLAQIVPPHFFDLLVRNDQTLDFLKFDQAPSVFQQLCATRNHGDL